MQPISTIARRSLLQTRLAHLPLFGYKLQNRLATLRCFSLLRPVSRSPLIRSRTLPQPRLSQFSRRHESSLTVPGTDDVKPPLDLTPSYQLTFTCKPCNTRSAHRVTKQGYHKGTVLIQCPNCKARHVITDHLKVFLDEGGSLEEILERANVGGKPLSDLLKKGKLGIRQGKIVGNEGEEDIEFWEDGTETTHVKDET